MKKFHILLCAAIIMLFISSCGSLKKVTYFQEIDKADIPEYAYITESQLKIMPNDNLYITVSTLDPEFAAPFNIIRNNMSTNINLETLAIQGYLVDSDGFINFPVLGALRVGGMTKTEATEYLQNRLSDHLVDPVVNLRFLNFRVTIMGEVARPGVYTFSEEKLNILEALGKAGDLTIYGKRNNVLLCRVVNGENKFYRINLNSTDIFSDPNLYLKQNDILYIQPNKTRASSSDVNPFFSLSISIVSLLATLATLIINVINK